MSKRLVEIDDELLERARSATRAGTIRATIEIALRSVVDRQTAVAHIEHLRRPGSLDLDRIEEARKPRLTDHG